MPFSSEQMRKTYSGNGSTTNFAFPWAFDNATDLDVYLVDQAGTVLGTAGADFFQEFVTEYDIVGAYDELTGEYDDFSDGASVNFVSAPATGYTVVLVRNTPDTQDTVLTTGGAFSKTTLERAFDKAFMVLQFLRDRSSRSVRMADSSPQTFDPTLPNPITAGSLIGVNDAGTGMELFDPEDVASAASASLADHLADTVDAHDASAISNIASGNLIATDVQGALNELQTDVDTREPAITKLSIAKGGTNSSTSLNNNRVMKSSGGTIVEASAITANRALISDANGIPTQSTTTSTELGYVAGLTSAVQTQIDGKQITGNYVTGLTGDVTASGPGSVAATLATVNSNVGSVGSSTSIPSFTVNAKGLITAAAGNVVVAPADTLTGTTLAANVVTSSLTAVGTIATGTWSATAIAINKGGTGQTTKAAAFDALSPMSASGDLVYGGASGTGTRLPKGTDGQYLKQVAGVPAWANATGGGGGGALIWFEDADAPTYTFNNGVMHYNFEPNQQQKMYTVIRVPTSYVVGSPIKLKIDWLSSDSSLLAGLQTLATLNRVGTDAASSTANQNTSTMSVSMGAGTANKYQSQTFDLTDSSGLINGVAVSVGDLIKVKFLEQGSTNTANIQVPLDGAEVTFS